VARVRSDCWTTTTAALFVYFLDGNHRLRDDAGRIVLDNNALAAITLMVALSKPEEKDIMCALVMNFLTRTG
jgi:hypothetical protein